MSVPTSIPTEHRRRLPFAVGSWRGRPGSRWGPVSRRGRWRRTVAARVVCGLLAGLAVWLVASAYLPAPPDPGVPAVVAIRDLPLGVTLSSSDVRLERRPADVVPVGVVTSVEAALGRVVSGPVTAGELVTSARFRGPPALAGMSAGTVAVSVPVADTGLVRSLRPADHVTVRSRGPARPSRRQPPSSRSTTPTPPARSRAGPGAPTS